MAKTSSMHIRIEQDTKKEVEKILKNLGMTATEAINIYLRQIILHSGIPFEIKTPKYSDDMLEAITEAEEMKKNPKKQKTFNTIEDFMEDLHNEIQD